MYKPARDNSSVSNKPKRRHSDRPSKVYKLCYVDSGRKDPFSILMESRSEPFRTNYTGKSVYDNYGRCGIPMSQNQKGVYHSITTCIYNLYTNSEAPVLNHIHTRGTQSACITLLQEC